MVMVDGEPVFSCLVPIASLSGREITTVEGLGTQENPGPMQRAFIEEQAAQCGYCIPGMMIQGQALLQRKPDATEADVRAALQPNLCRCGTHMRIIRAIVRAGETMQQADAETGRAAG
jgi:nicotinate dehydrogenase subunit A